MWKRFVTGVLLTLFLIAVLLFGGYVFAAVAFFVCGLCVFEALSSLKKAGTAPCTGRLISR